MYLYNYEEHNVFSDKSVVPAGKRFGNLVFHGGSRDQKQPTLFRNHHDPWNISGKRQILRNNQLTDSPPQTHRGQQPAGNCLNAPVFAAPQSIKRNVQYVHLQL